ncbi:MAG: VOC family protein [Nanoarchaeota archaeon]|nr:VOC family protein [Nanoarchaeota archaeon]
MVKQIFVNLPVKDLQKSIDFFTKLGFTFNPKFTDENATCMVIGENIFAMLLVEKFFKSFITKDVCDTSKSTEALFALAMGSKEEVDVLVDRALEAGGKSYRRSDDYGWMYTRVFADLDGHCWEIFYMDESKMPRNG